jgi:hypothetical protein
MANVSLRHVYKIYDGGVTAVGKCQTAIYVFLQALIWPVNQQPSE